MPKRDPLPRLKPPVDDSGIELLGYDPHPVEDEDRGFMGSWHEDHPLIQAETYIWRMLKVFGAIVGFIILWFVTMKGK